MSATKIGILGRGNLGYHLYVALSKGSYDIVQLNRKDIEEAGNAGLAKHKTMDFDFVVLAVSDQNINEAARALPFKDSIVLHTSGGTGLNVFRECHIENYGVFYPLQSFSRNRELDYREIPVLIEANNERVLNRIRKLAETMSDHVVEIDSVQRKKIHLIAVVLNNFVNHLYNLSQDYLDKNSLPFDLFKPLIRETGIRLQSGNARNFQTGPAMRKDMKVVETHLELLKGDPELQSVYQFLTTSIINWYR